MKNQYILVIKGFIVGLGKIIPGVSGALLAIGMGIYDKALSAIGNFFKDIKNNIMFLMPIGIGLLLAIIFFGNVIAYLLNKHYFITMLLFLGLIIGGIPSLLKNFYKIKFNYKDYYFIFVVSIMLLICYGLSKNNLLDMNYLKNYNFIYWLVIGAIDALTMIVPGISGTATFIMLGCYQEIIDMYAHPFSNLTSIIPFLIGVVIAIIWLTKIIALLFKKCSKSLYMVILFLLIISIVSLVNNVVIVTFTNIQLMLGLIFLFLGFIISYKLEK